MKSKLSVFMKKINANKQKWTNASKGTDFEDRIINELKASGFNRVVARDKKVIIDKTLHDYLSEIKDKVQKKTGSTLLDNTLKDKGSQYVDVFVWQPYGTQDYPDFLVFTENKIYSIEVKYSTDKGTKPMWNSNLPKSDGIYIFGSYGHNDITYFRGEDVLPENERVLLTSMWDKADEAFKEWGRDFLVKYNNQEIFSHYGFYPYIRRAYDQNLNLNQNAILDFFNNPNRISVESKAIDFVTKTDVKNQNTVSI